MSASEGGQQKQLLILDKNWGIESTIPLDVGHRHFQISSADPDIPEDLRPNDRVRWMLPSGASARDVDSIQQRLQDKGQPFALLASTPSSWCEAVNKPHELRHENH